MRKSPGPQGGRQPLRIIGGQWRGRRLNFVASDGLRPTGDRIRETLFNWLTADIAQARCLDLFAGSGILGLEALSRGAAHCHFVDTQALALNQIQSHLDTLDATEHGRCHTTSAQHFLHQSAPQSVDIAFIDPPFSHDLLADIGKQLEQSDCLSRQALIYVEHDKQQTPALPANWWPKRKKETGNVCYGLYERR